MARLRIDTAPEVTIFDESFIIKAAASNTGNLVEFKNSSNVVVTSVNSTRRFNSFRCFHCTHADSRE